MKRFKTLTVLFAIALFMPLFAMGQTDYYPASDGRYVYNNPDWAPDYYNGVRYYYLPDIETYYDLSNQVFIFLDHGRWCYSRTIPAIYAGLNLYDCFSIALNINVFRPWMHHQYYISHYPRYYYRDYYDHSNIPYVRGYNENTRRAFFWKDNERNHARDWNDERIRDSRFKYSREDRQHQIQPEQSRWRQPSGQDRPYGTTHDYNQQQDNRQQQNNRNNGGALSDHRQENNNTNSQQRINRHETENNTQGTNYYGKSIGQPVRVERQMREPKQSEIRSSGNANIRNNTNARSTDRTNNRR